MKLTTYIVDRFGGINPNHLNEHGISYKDNRHIFLAVARKYGSGLDEIANDLISEGIIRLMRGNNPSDQLIIELYNNPEVDELKDLDPEIERLQFEYDLEQHRAKIHENKTKKETEGKVKSISLRALTGEIKKYKIATFDIEANNWTEFLMCAFYDGEIYKEFYSIKDFLKFVLTEKYKSYRIFAHFAGRYDFLFLLEHLGSRAKIIHSNGRILQLKIQLYSEDRSYIYFVDSFSLLPTSLDQLSKAFDVRHKKQTGKIDFSKRLKITKTLKEYLKNDVIGLYEILDKFQSELNAIGAEMKITIASTAMDLFRRKYLDIEIPSHYKHEQFIRSGYYGGRVEVFNKYFKAGSGPLYDYDYNSLYPSVMIGNYYPVGNAITVDNYNYNPADIGYVEISANIPKNIKIPPLPFRQENKMLIFPVGKIRAVYPLIYLSVLNQLKIPYTIHKAILFEKYKLFDSYIKDLYAERMKNKGTVKYLIYKLLLNSTYGKFGQQRLKEDFIIIPNAEDFKNDLKIYNTDVDLWYRERESFSAHILPGIAGYVTGYAHLNLYNELSRFADSVYYCDTDSLFITDELLTGEHLGQLKIEDTIKEAIFINPKLYAYRNTDDKEVIKAKGFKTDELNFKSFEKVLFENNTEDFNQSFNRVFGFRSALKAKNNINNSYLFYGTVKKSLKSFDLKRNFIRFQSTPKTV